MPTDTRAAGASVKRRRSRTGVGGGVGAGGRVARHDADRGGELDVPVRPALRVRRRLAEVGRSGEEGDLLAGERLAGRGQGCGHLRLACRRATGLGGARRWSAGSARAPRPPRGRSAAGSAACRQRAAPPTPTDPAPRSLICHIVSPIGRKPCPLQPDVRARTCAKGPQAPEQGFDRPSVGVLTKLRSRLTYANTMSTIAVFVALGGGAYAVSVPRNSVGPTQLKTNAVTAAKVKNRSLLVGLQVRPAHARHRRARRRPGSAGRARRGRRRQDVPQTRSAGKSS